MIIALVRRHGRDFEMRVDGHATLPGGEVVCAAVSALVFAFYGAMKDIASDGGAVYFKHAMEKGHAEIAIRTSARHAGRARAVFDCVVGALRMTEEKYKCHIRVTEM